MGSQHTDEADRIEFEYEFEVGDKVVYKDYTKDESGDTIEQLRAGKIIESPPVDIVVGKDCINPTRVQREDSYRISGYSDGVWSFMLPDRIVGPLSVYRPDINTLDQPHPNGGDP